MKTESNPIQKSEIALPPLVMRRPLLLIGHGTRNPQGRQTFLDFAQAYSELDASRPVISGFLELTEPTIHQAVDQCVDQGYEEISALPLLLFAARHNKFDITNELDRARTRHPQIKFHYGRHFGIHPRILELWRSRLQNLDHPDLNPDNVPRPETVLLFVGRGSSDPDANSDVYKLARMLWEGSGYSTVETCFIGITHPRLEEGFRRARLYNPQRIIVLPYFLFTGVLVQKIFDITAQQQEQYPEIRMTCLPEMGMHPELMYLLRERELETQVGQVQMNCEACKFRLAAVEGDNSHVHVHHHGHDHEPDQGHPHSHSHGHHHDSNHPQVDPYANPEQYHQRIWQVP
ncbi:MAG: sirohydrochlorin chelatase [Microcoleaceae cyanobacterium]